MEPSHTKDVEVNYNESNYKSELSDLRTRVRACTSHSDLKMFPGSLDRVYKGIVVVGHLILAVATTLYALNESALVKEARDNPSLSITQTVIEKNATGHFNIPQPGVVMCMQRPSQSVFVMDVPVSDTIDFFPSGFQATSAAFSNGNRHPTYWTSKPGAPNGYILQQPATDFFPNTEGMTRITLKTASDTLGLEMRDPQVPLVLTLTNMRPLDEASIDRNLVNGADQLCRQVSRRNSTVIETSGSYLVTYHIVEVYKRNSEDFAEEDVLERFYRVDEVRKIGGSRVSAEQSRSATSTSRWTEYKRQLGVDTSDPCLCTRTISSTVDDIVPQSCRCDSEGGFTPPATSAPLPAGPGGVPNPGGVNAQGGTTGEELPTRPDTENTGGGGGTTGGKLPTGPDAGNTGGGGGTVGPGRQLLQGAADNNANKCPERSAADAGIVESICYTEEFSKEGGMSQLDVYLQYEGGLEIERRKYVDAYSWTSAFGAILGFASFGHSAIILIAGYIVKILTKKEDN